MWRGWWERRRSGADHAMDSPLACQVRSVAGRVRLMRDGCAAVRSGQPVAAPGTAGVARIGQHSSYSSTARTDPEAPYPQPWLSCEYSRCLDCVSLFDVANVRAMDFYPLANSSWDIPLFRRVAARRWPKLLGNRACSLFMHTVRLIHGHVLPVLRRVDVNNGPFPSRIGLPHSILAETDRHACIIPPASLGIRSPTCARWSTRKRRTKGRGSGRRSWDCSNQLSWR